MDDLHLVMNTISLTVVGYFIFQFISLVSPQPWNTELDLTHSIDEITESISPQIAKPDIYYIILDAYGRADMLQAVYGFDNSEFVTALEQKGFNVALNSQANYPKTLLSLSSSLNMQYLDTMATSMGDSDLWWPAMDAIKHSQVRKQLENWGYKTVFFATDWDFTDIHDGDYYESPFKVMLNNYGDSFLYLTNLSIFKGLSKLGLDFPSYDTHRQLILYNLSRLPEIAPIPGPKFTFVHILAPHPPYVFDSQGNPIDPDHPFYFGTPRDSYTNRNGYLDQLIFINQEILKSIDGILMNSPEPPIIILQADHGPDIYSDFNSYTDNCFFEIYSILNAYYLPGLNEAFLPMDISPVNTFRIIFNQYFETNFEILPDQQFFSVIDSIYEMINVTGITQQDCEIDD